MFDYVHLSIRDILGSGPPLLGDKEVNMTQPPAS